MNLAVKLPDDLRDRICSFPFLQTLVKELRKRINLENEKRGSEEEKTLKVHLLCVEEGIETLYLLPFQAFYHELGNEDLKSVFTGHRAVKNLKLENIDVFLTLTKGFVDASLGKSMGAKKTFGINYGKNSFLLDKKTAQLKGRHLAEQLHPLLSLFLENPPQEPAKGFSRELAPIREDWRDDPYVMVNLSSDGEAIKEHWQEFFALAEEGNFILSCDDLNVDRQKEILADFVRKLPVKNRYEIVELESLIDFAKLVSHAETFFSEDSSLVHIASYCGSHVHYMRKKDPIHRNGCLYFIGEVRMFDLNEPFFKESGAPAYHKVFDEVFKFMETKKTKRNKNTEKEKN